MASFGGYDVFSEGISGPGKGREKQDLWAGIQEADLEEMKKIRELMGRRSAVGAEADERFAKRLKSAKVPINIK